MLVYFECSMGSGIRDYRDLRSAIRGITKEVGTANNPANIRKATKEDIEWVKAMGGFIP